MNTDIIAMLDDAAADLNEQLSVIGSCGNAHCLILAPEKQHTNGGCQCWQDRIKMQRFAFAMNRYRDRIASITTAEQRKS
ncbi:MULTISPECIES: hypothetical protein [unclassified Brucella]|uniref:hypothetical protein n=1 Tax=unclassified Brucella TaxID=2632610 RepID=UPI0012AEA8A6|nr:MULTISPECIES: hypothetical protein [unclassified Brucella]MRN43426.1 hypothetical protein [Brucella sp. 09RB8913]MRN59400.1 hypothetical protein [Brucella sp. 09RB8918]MRN67944.1 hypothetical protein [Brucella sp. 10RB9213]